MKGMTRFVVALALAMIWAGAGAGRDDKSKETPDKVRDKLPPENPKTQFVTREVRGELMAVQPDLAVVRSAAGKMNLEVTPDTRVRIGIRDATVADLRPGMNVTAFYIERPDRKTAMTIVVESPVIVDAG